METKCETLKLSIAISMVTLIFFTAFFILNKYFENLWYEYIYNISLGMFGSSFVVFLISIAEYKVAKTQLLEKIWNESRNLNIQIHKIEPLLSNIDDNLLIDYINEWQFSQTKKDNILFGNKREAYDKLYEYFFENYKNKLKNMSKKETKEYINLLIETERKRVLENLEKIIYQYLNINNYSFLEMNNLLGDVQFFSGKKQCLKIYRDIYEPLRNMYNDLKEKVCYHFELYHNGEANRIDVLLSILLEYQKNLFRIEKEVDENSEWYIIYASFCDDMEDKLEEFRANVIYHCTEEKISHQPICTRFYNKI